MEQEEYRIRKRKLLKHFSIIALSVAVAIYIQTSAVADILVSYFSSIYFIPSAFLVGFLFSITFTAAISTSVFILLAETTHNPFLIALIGGLGSLAANSIVYKFFKEEIIDDIRFIAGKVSTQEEFFHTLDALLRTQRQIIITSDRPPKDFVNIEE